MQIDNSNKDLYQAYMEIQELYTKKRGASKIQAQDNQTKANDLKNIYVDPVKISELNLKAAHTVESVLNNERLAKDNTNSVNFRKESYFFKKENLQSVEGSLSKAQANIDNSRVLSLLD